MRAKPDRQASRKGILRRLFQERRGVGAIEFAFIAPVMIVLYIGAVEVSVAMSVNKKLARASSTVADLLTQETTANKAKLMNMVNVAKSIMAPYPHEPINVVVTGIAIDGSGTATVDWSWKPNSSSGEAAYQAGSETDIPDNLRIPDTYLVRSELTYRHDMITTFPFTGKTMTGIDMSKSYHLRPRIGSEVDCTDC
jgi:Flp pilus assembly protein TadG